ncbi:large subunit ribosomal protein L7Ae [Vigna unguiculata]|uniref:RING-type E3 ubiquitin transferase n=1 Tax=Vigna unguiculata TaxID=3917 RepID=A0A4D6KPQ6_VIGUN|nr:large subunit ribosomal protein L7Ae [Vigna unguiculata]
MENFTCSPSPLSAIPSISAPSSSAPFDDSFEDSCSICLESFTIHEPSTVTNCKHEYHLHCILEWSQRSQECPICWQSLALKDPASQELLAAVEVEKRLRSRKMTTFRTRLEQYAYEDDFFSDDSDSDDQIMRRLVAAANRSRLVQRQERNRSPGAGPSDVLDINSSIHVSGVQTISPSSGPASGVTSTFNSQPPVSNTTSESANRPNTYEMFSFPESFKSKFSAASTRYKESISKGTRGLKEKLLAHNVSVKELSKGVQREMNAGIAGVARMIERLDLSKRSNFPIIPIHSEGTSDFPKEGKKYVGENGIGGSPSKESEGAVHDVSSDVPFVTGVQSFGPGYF